MAESVASKVVEDVDELSVFGVDIHTVFGSKPDAFSEVAHRLQPCSRFTTNQEYQPTSLHVQAGRSPGTPKFPDMHWY